MTKKMSAKDTLAAFLSATPEQLAERQIAAIETLVTDRLREIINLIQNGHFEKVYLLLDESPAGDGWGSENRFIAFPELDALAPVGTHSADIGTAVDRLIQLREQAGKGKSKSKGKS